MKIKKIEMKPYLKIKKMARAKVRRQQIEDETLK